MSYDYDFEFIFKLDDTIKAIKKYYNKNKLWSSSCTKDNIGQYIILTIDMLYSGYWHTDIEEVDFSDDSPENKSRIAVVLPFECTGIIKYMVNKKWAVRVPLSSNIYNNYSNVIGAKMLATGESVLCDLDMQIMDDYVKIPHIEVSDSFHGIVLVPDVDIKDIIKR